MFTDIPIGMLIGVIIYDLVINGFVRLYTGISAFMILIYGQVAKKIKQTISQIEVEINWKNTM